MKRLLLLIIVFFIPLFALAEVIYPTIFLPNADVVYPMTWYGKIWNVRYEFMNQNNRSMVLYSDITGCIVGEKSYVPICVGERNLIVRGGTLQSNTNSSEAIKMLYRQEGDRIYYLTHERDAEILILNYGLKKGDSFQSPDGKEFVVTETGYFSEYGKWVYCSNEEKPRMIRLYAEETGEEDVWIEGMGSVHWGIAPKFVLKDAGVFDDVPTNAQVFRCSTNGDIDIYDCLFDINEENYKLVHYELGEECNKEEAGLDFSFVADTLCVSGVFCPQSTFGPECIECLVTDEGTIAMALYGFHVLTTNSTYRRIDVRIPGFKPGTYFIDGKTLECKGKNTNYYYYNGKKIPLTLNESKVVINIPKTCDEASKRIRTNVQVLNTIADETFDIFVISRSDFEKLASLDFWEEDATSVILTSSYYTEDNNEVFATPYLNVKLKEEQDIEILNSYADEYGLRIVGNMPSMPLWYILHVTPSSEKSPLKCANELYETGYFSASAPDFVAAPDNGSDPDDGRTLQGTVIDQDGNPIEGAIVSYSLLGYWDGEVLNKIETRTEKDGSFTLKFDDDEGFPSFLITAPGHAPFKAGPYADFLNPINQSVIEKVIILYNAIDYVAGEQSTIVLPVTPDASLGRYFRYDRLDKGKVIFEREYNPQANIPYVIIPNRDFTVDISEMDLTQEIQNTIAPIATYEASFFGSYSSIAYQENDESHEYWPIDEGGDEFSTEQNDTIFYMPKAMHATLILHFLTYLANDFEIIFHDPDEDYIPFVEEGKVWELGFIPNNGDSAESLNFFYLDGDTIVNDIRCSKMMLQYVDKESRLTTYAASIYEHEGQVHCAFHGSETFELLYDFVAEVGDTIEIYDPQNLWGTHHTPAVIVSKEHGYDQKEPLWEGGFVQYIKGTVTKVAAITPYNKDLSAEELAKQAEWWIEGVGFMGNPLNNILVEQVTGGYDALMQCTIDADTLYYTSRYTEDVTSYWSDEDNEAKKQKIDFTHVIKTKPTSPQPVTTNISLLWGEYSNAVLNIDFEGMNGRYKINVRKDGEQQDRFSANQETHNLQSLDVNLAGYPDGDYTVVVENDGESFTAHFALPLDGTGIESIQNSKFKIDNNAPVYDLSGRRVVNPKRGLYIQGNKKIIKQ